MRTYRKLSSRAFPTGSIPDPGPCIDLGGRSASGSLADRRNGFRTRRPHLQDHEPVLVVHGAVSLDAILSAVLRAILSAVLRAILSAVLRAILGAIRVAGARLRRVAILLALIGGKVQRAGGEIHASLGHRIEDIAT